MRITISGTAGSGKSTIAKLLAEKLGYRHYSMGDIQREIAKEKGLTIVELGELEKTDPSIDRMIDDRQKKLGETQDNFVIDAWLSPHFIPKSFKIFMDADIKVRSERVFQREPGQYKDMKDAARKIKQREDTNRKRWIEFYGYDFRDMKNYEMVVDTTGKTVEEILGSIRKKLQR